MKVSKFLACSHDDSSWRRISRDVERMGAKCSKSCIRQSRRFVLSHDMVWTIFSELLVKI